MYKFSHWIKLSVCKPQHFTGEVEVAMEEAGVREEGDREYVH